MPRAIQIQKQGKPSVMKWVEIPLAKPKSGEILINQSHVGLNYIDVYHRSGLYPLPMPHGIGMEAAGTVEAVGRNVKGLKVGDRVAYASGPQGPMPKCASCQPTVWSNSRPGYQTNRLRP